MNRLLAALGVLCLVAFAVVWWPAALLLAGLTLLALAQIRRINERRTANR